MMGKYAAKYSAAIKDKVNNLENKINTMVAIIAVLTIGSIVGFNVMKK